MMSDVQIAHLPAATESNMRRPPLEAPAQRNMLGSILTSIASPLAFPRRPVPFGEKNTAPAALNKELAALADVTTRERSSLNLEH